MKLQYISKKLMRMTFFLSLCFSVFCQPYNAIAQKENLHSKANLDVLAGMNKKSSLSNVELQKARETMLALMNEARANSNYRKIAGSKTALNLQTGLKPLVLNEKLNKMAQEQADYQASIGKTTHDNARYRDFGARVEQHLGKNPKYGAPEACGSGMNLEEWPIIWMQSETHYREVWNLGAFPTTAVGFGVKKDPKDGYWYLTAVWSNFGDEVTTSTPANPTATCDAKDAVKKYQTSMKPGERLSGKEKMVSANGRFQFRITTDGNYVIEEVLSSGACPYKEVYRFPLANGGSKPGVSFFSYNPDGNICMDSQQGKTHCATTGKDATAGVILYKSVKLELTDDGRLRLVNKEGQEIWATKPGSKTSPTNPTTTACGLTIKYKGYMTPGSIITEHEALVSANGRYQFRNNDGKLIIEEVVNRNNCQFKEVYDFSLVVTLSPYASQFNGGKRGFSYTRDGDIVYIPNISLGVFSDNPKNPSNHKDSPKVDVRNKSTKLELTNEGILRLVNNSGQVIWTTTK